MNTPKHNLFSIAIALCLIALPFQVCAKPSTAKLPKQAEASKERLVLMPLRLEEDQNKLQGAMETALLEGLQQKYEVFSGEQVAKKAREIFMKESKNTTHSECDETRCLQGIAEAFQAELLAIANVTKQDGGYFLALSIRNIFDNKVVYSKSMPCKSCDSFQAVDKLKELVGISAQASVDNAVEKAAAVGKLKLEQLQKAQLERDQALLNADAEDRKRLLGEKARDDEQIAKLKAEAEARKNSHAVQNRKDFPSVQSATEEIKRLNERIAAIETGYQKEVERIRAQIGQRYQARFNALDKEQKGEFESSQDFNARQQQRRAELQLQRDNEKVPTVAELAEGETNPLRKFILDLRETEYALGAEDLVPELAPYNTDKQQFPLHIHGSNPAVTLELNANIPLPLEAAKIFKQHWQAGLVRPEAKVKPEGRPYDLVLVDDADKTRMTFDRNLFMSKADWEKWNKKEAERQAAEAARQAAAEKSLIEYETQHKQSIKDAAFNKMFFPLTRGAFKNDAPFPKLQALTLSPFSIFSDILFSPLGTKDYMEISKEAAFNPGKWAKPDSLLANAAEFEQQQAYRSPTLAYR